MRKGRKMEWTAECEEVFGQLKEYLASALLLSTPREGDKLYLYLVVSKWATRSVLVREDVGKQHPMYYTSKALVDTETRYPLMEKYELALITAARNLRPYLQAHPIVVMTDQLLRQILQKPDACGFRSVFRRGWSVITTIGWAWKYGLSLRAAVTKASAHFSIRRF